MSAFEAFFLILLLAIAVTILARRSAAPLPVVLAAFGIVLGIAWRWIPGAPLLAIPASLVLPIFLPPLLAGAAYAVPLGAFRANLRPITLLAVGLVLVTMAVAAAIAHAAVEGLPWSAAFTLGAIIAPPDPVAVTSVAPRMGLAHRLVTILEGEGLVNDATAIVAYHLAVAAAVTGRFAWSDAVLQLIGGVTLGVAIGLGIGWLTAELRRHLDDTPLEASLSLLAPYVAYLLAERVHGSGVLAVVALGFLLRRLETRISSPAARLGSRAVWSAIEFIDATVVFVLVGFAIGQLASGGVMLDSLRAGALVAGGVVLVRLAWMSAVPMLTRAIRGPDRTLPSPGERVVLGWAGMRGVVSLALAFALPATTATGAPFPMRGSVILLAASVIVATLVLQGFTLVPLVHLLGVGDPESARRDERRARARARRAALASLARERERGALTPRECAMLRRRVALGLGTGDAASRDHVERALRDALGAARAVVLRMRDAGHISEDLSDELEAELDVDAVRLRGEQGRVIGS